MKKGFEDEIQALGQDICKNYGVDCLTGKAVISLYLEPKELSLEKLADMTGYSLSTMSTKMKLLERIGIVKRIKKAGSRKAYYYMEKDIRKLMITKLHYALQSEIMPVKMSLPAIIERHKKSINASKDERKKKMLQNMENYLEQMTMFEKLIKETIQKLQNI